jgi:transcriptional pleiotropic regulator of transition state genes
MRARQVKATEGSPREATTGIVRQVDELGRIVIPIEIRKSLGIGEKDPLEISVENETIRLSKPQDLCVFCGAGEPLSEHRGRNVCGPCIAELSTQSS